MWSNIRKSDQIRNPKNSTHLQISRSVEFSSVQSHVVKKAIIFKSVIYLYRNPTNIRPQQTEVPDCKYIVSKANITRIYPYKVDSRFNATRSWEKKVIRKEKAKRRPYVQIKHEMDEHLYTDQYMFLDEVEYEDYEMSDYNYTEDDDLFYGPPRHEETSLDILLLSSTKKDLALKSSRYSKCERKKRRAEMKNQQQQDSKTHIIYIDEPLSQEFETAGDNVTVCKEEIEVEDPYLKVQLSKYQISPERLEETYGDHCIEGNTMPRRFFVTESIVQIDSPKILVIVKPEPKDNKDFATVTMAFKGFSNRFDFDVLLPTFALNETSFDTIVKFFLTEINSPKTVDQIASKKSTFVSAVETKSTERSFGKFSFFGKKSNGLLPVIAVQTQDHTQHDNEAEAECQICFIELSENEHFRNRQCLHSFCDSCLQEYIKSRVRDGYASQILCMASKCSAQIDPVTILSMVSWRTFCSYASAFEKCLIRSSKNVQLCPTDFCRNVVVVNDSKLLCEERRKVTPFKKSLIVKCEACVRDWCFHCKQSNHWPLSCQSYGKFKTKIEKLKNLDADGRLRKMEVVGKHCPFCGSFVEKNGGCIVMTCICSHENFCWICTRPLKEHGMYSLCPTKKEVFEKEFVPYNTKSEARFAAVVQDFVTSNDPTLIRELSSHLKAQRRTLTINDLKSTLATMKVLKKSVRISSMLTIGNYLEPKGTPVLYKILLQKLRFLNTLAMHSLENRMGSNKNKYSIELTTLCQEIDDTISRLSESL